MVARARDPERDRELLVHPYYPFWSIVMIALAVWVIWALTRPGVLRYWVARVRTSLRVGR